jgi:hypothetical protein
MWEALFNQFYYRTDAEQIGEDVNGKNKGIHHPWSFSCLRNPYSILGIKPTPTSRNTRAEFELQEQEMEITSTQSKGVSCSTERHETPSILKHNSTTPTNFREAKVLVAATTVGRR